MTSVLTVTFLYSLAVLALACVVFYQDKRLEKLERLYADLVPVDDFSHHV